MLPIIAIQARADRVFLGRAVRHLAAEPGPQGGPPDPVDEFAGVARKP